MYIMRPLGLFKYPLGISDKVIGCILLSFIKATSFIKAVGFLIVPALNALKSSSALTASVAPKKADHSSINSLLPLPLLTWPAAL